MAKLSIIYKIERTLIGIKFGIIYYKSRHLINIETILDKPLLDGFILSNDPESHQITSNITAVKVAMFLG